VRDILRMSRSLSRWRSDRDERSSTGRLRRGPGAESPFELASENLRREKSTGVARAAEREREVIEMRSG